MPWSHKPAFFQDNGDLGKIIPAVMHFQHKLPDLGPMVLFDSEQGLYLTALYVNFHQVNIVKAAFLDD
jgi:hypothetical protein